MRKILESVFDLLYLAVILVTGVLMLYFAQGSRVGSLFGLMALVLGGGDLFHLLPRLHTLWTGKPAVTALGIGKWVTSLTATAYYLLLLEVWIQWHHLPGSPWRTLLWGLAILRVLLCCMPQNRWLQPNPPLAWGVLRNIPFVLMGLLLAGLYLWKREAPFQWMPLAIGLSFAFYLPVVLLGAKKPALGMLMMPKTVVYLWIQGMGYLAVWGPATAMLP